MTQSVITQETAQSINPHLSTRLTLRWALKRALLGLTIMVVVISGSAWLLYTTIDQNVGDERTNPLVPTATTPMAMR